MFITHPSAGSRTLELLQISRKAGPAPYTHSSAPFFQIQK